MKEVLTGPFQGFFVGSSHQRNVCFCFDDWTILVCVSELLKPASVC